MISELKLLNYNDKIYKVFMEDRTLYINFNGKTTELSKDVLGYCLEYLESSLWISFYDKSYSIFIIEIEANQNRKMKINKHLSLNFKRYAKRIDSLTMLVKNKKQINIIFRGWNNDRAFIFNSNISISNNLNIISDNSFNNYNKPFVTYSYDDNAFVLISEKEEAEEYTLYNLLDESTVNSFSLNNIYNLALVRYKERPIIFYNKKIKNDLYIKYRYLDISENSGVIDKEQSIDCLPKNIINPQISVYMGNMYLIWNSNEGIKSAISKDLGKWDINRRGIDKAAKCISTCIIKVMEEKIEKINTYVRNDIVYNLINNKKNLKDNENNYKLMELLLYENNLKNKIQNINNVITLDEYYSKRYEEYLYRINELNKIIEEKDKLIYKLIYSK